MKCLMGLACGVALLVVGSTAIANIYEWQKWDSINDYQYSISSILCPDGSGISAGADGVYDGLNLTKAYLKHMTLTNTSFQSANLTIAIFDGSNLTGANFTGATLNGTSFWNVPLANAIFTNADITNASFYNTTNKGFTAAQLYSTANYKNSKLCGVDLSFNDLTNWNFAGKNLTNGSVYCSTLTGTDFTDAVITGADFGYATARGFTSAQLYSTGSYKKGDLTGIGLIWNNLTGWNFTGQNLTGVDFGGATLTNTVFSDAIINGSLLNDSTDRGFTADQLYSTVSYKNKDLSGIDFRRNTMTNWSFANQNLTKVSMESANLKNASFQNANLTRTYLSYASVAGADFTHAIIAETDFEHVTDLTSEQIYSTASYKNRNLSGIILSMDTLSSINLRDQNLSRGRFERTDFTKGDLSGANLTNAFLAYTVLTGTNLSRADLRGSYAYNPKLDTDPTYADLSVANTSNAILPDGRIKGLNLTGGEVLKIRDYDLNNAGKAANRAITIKDSAGMASDATLRFIFTDGQWGSTISFEEGIPVHLDGVLDLTFADDVDAADFTGTTYDLFNWDNITPTGTFSSILDHGLTWDLSKLYTTGEITLVAVPEPTGISLIVLGSLVLFRRRHLRFRCHRAGCAH